MKNNKYISFRIRLLGWKLVYKTKHHYVYDVPLKAVTILYHRKKLRGINVKTKEVVEVIYSLYGTHLSRSTAYYYSWIYMRYIKGDL